ncbi:autotransporter domain-containing protein [uncultured Brevundimonas sp.]|uniref:autotransporter outer membrane beta-barrel domain-containing protein n=1 Tax=uncultured Brevundimonas sp. TaxID=213418 RepID=UPI0030ECAC13|tara:strand:+ start:14423 stop:17599 length:3177 start_codon:yes stop_codon:yes gene_type:complete
MRKLLATAVAIAPLMAAAGAHAEIVISTTRTTPITTANATGTGPDSIRIASGGAINVTTGNVVTLNSSHNIIVDSGGSIGGVNTANGTTGILANGGNTGSITISGSVTVGDDIATYPDTDSDGDLDGVWANGSDRFGIRLAGASPLTGDIRLNSSSSLVVDGVNSVGISIESGLVGNLTTLGSLQVFGDNAIGVRTTSTIDGNVMLSGTMAVFGANTSAVSIQGDVNGRLVFQGDILSSGYRYTTRPPEAVIAKLEPDDMLQNRSAVIVAGNVSGGVVFDQPPVDADPNNADEDNDGVPDATETKAFISSFGAAPAVTVGSASRSVTLGVAGTGDSAFGFINRGTLTGQGVYDGIQGNGVLFGVPGGQIVTIDGGVRNEGTISGLSFEADATAMRFATGATTPQIVNTGNLSAGATSALASQVTALQIDAGASVPSVSNSGVILATAIGSTVNTTGIRDLSGTLTSITNTRLLQATLTPNAAGDPITGSATAIDVRANTTGVTIMQTGPVGAGSPTDLDTDGDGVPDIFEPAITGAIRLGSGNDFVDIRNGEVNGDIYFGAGADRLTITGGGVVRGALSDSDGLLDISVVNGLLDARQTSPLNVTSLNIGANGNLLVTLDPASGGNSGFVVSGTATLATGAGLGVNFTSLIDSPSRFTIIDAATLNLGTVDLNSIQTQAPYLFMVNAGADVPAGDVYVDVRRRTAAEANLIPAEAQMFNSFYGALGSSSALRDVFLAQTDRTGFIGLYEQMLPDHSGGSLLSLASGVDAVTRALTGRNTSAAPGEVSAWVQEINFYADKDKTDTYGFRSEGIGFAGGVERGSGLGAVGVSLAFTSSDIQDPEAEAAEVLSSSLIELGLYWRAQGQYWTTWARAAAGYATFDSTRQFVGGGLNLKNAASWNGLTLAAAGGASYERSFGRFGVRPEVYAEYFSLREDARTETGGGNGFDLSIDQRTGHLFSAVAAVNFSMGMGEDSWLRPEVRVGWRQNLSVDPGETIARFVGGGADFRLTPNTIEGGGPLLGFRLNIGNELGMLSISADAEKIEDYVRYMLLLRASFRF